MFFNEIAMTGDLQRGSAWVPWSNDRSVEYQIKDNFLRIRQWSDGRLVMSEWTAWERSTEETVRKQLRALQWDALPQHVVHRPAAAPPDWKHHLAQWFRDHFVRG